MGRVCDGPRVLWAEFVMGQDVPDPVPYFTLVRCGVVRFKALVIACRTYKIFCTMSGKFQTLPHSRYMLHVLSDLALFWLCE